MRCATSAELVAGLLTTGMPASSADRRLLGQAPGGKLKALMWTATPRRGTTMCWPWKRGRAAQRDALAVDEEAAPRPAPCRARRRSRRREDRAVHVELGVAARVAAVARRRGRAARRGGPGARRHIALSSAPRSREGQRAQGRPRRRAREARGAPRQVEPAPRRLGQRLLGGGVDERLARRPSLDPAAADVAREACSLRDPPAASSTNA